MIPISVDGTQDFESSLLRLLRRGADDLESVAPAVREIIAAVRSTGDAAVSRYVETFERRTPASLVVHPFDGSRALARLVAPVRTALELAAKRIQAYHEHQVVPGFAHDDGDVRLAMRVRPLSRVGVYAPGGKARYPSSVLMAAIPARVAGVKDIVLASPAPDDAVLAAAHLAGVTTHLDAGGAHAIAAMAYGTSSLPRVDKIVGPGNAYVACAKKLVFGDVDIDGIAGPSEILIIADDDADPALVAADLLSQAEHDEAAYAILVCTSLELAKQVARDLDQQLATLPRRAIAGASIDQRGLVLVAKDRTRMLAIANDLAAEHVAIHACDADAILECLPIAGAVLVGSSTPVATGDYFAGPSHVLPTGGSARFGSPLGVYDFVARSSVIRYSRAALAQQAPHITALARAEGLEAHARAVELRFSRPESQSDPIANAVREPQSDD